MVVSRTLSKAKAATRRALIDAARTLATEGGYDAVGMREVAAAAGVSAATAYQYYSSKDHLLVDVLVELDWEATAALDEHPPEGDTPAERVSNVLGRAIRRMEREPDLYAALVRAYVSGGTPGGTPLAVLLPERNWIKIALPEDVPDRDVVLHIVQSLYLAAMVHLVSGIPPSELAEGIERTVRHLLPPS